MNRKQTYLRDIRSISSRRVPYDIATMRKKKMDIHAEGKCVLIFLMIIQKRNNNNNNSTVVALSLSCILF